MIRDFLWSQVKSQKDRAITNSFYLDFLSFSKLVGNDLSTPMPQYGFDGLKDGDKWCLCALRWKEALINNVAPKVLLEATNEKTLSVITMKDLITHSYKEWVTIDFQWENYLYYWALYYFHWSKVLFFQF